jgi:hypothetical protein
MAALRSLVGLPLCVTELGFPRPGTEFAWHKYERIWTYGDEAASIDATYTALAREARMVAWYQLFPDRPSWDTALFNHPDARSTPAFEQLRATMTRING